MGIRAKFILTLTGILCLGGVLMMAWFYYSSHKNVENQAIQSASFLSDSLHAAVYGFMRTGDQQDLEIFVQKASKLQSVDEIRVIRAPLLEKELGESKGDYVMDDLDHRALSSGQIARKTVKVKGGEAVRAVIPVIAEESCTACHASVLKGDTMALLRTTLMFQATVDTVGRDLLKASLFQVLILMVVIGTIYILFSKFMANPLSSLAAGVDLVSRADLTQMVRVGSRDEIGGLAARFNGMTEELKNIIKKVQGATGQITVASSEILTASQGQASTARNQSSSVAETTSAVQQLSATSVQVGEKIRKVAQFSAHVLAGMSMIKEAISKTNDRLTALGEKSQKIGKLIELIDDVADKTNLLAVNAAIEAALAGEQGRGFTVVAVEIRKLADSTAASTRDITTLIELIQHEMSQAIASMEESVQGVDEETRLAQEAMEKTKEIEISASQQISGFKQIADAMIAIDEAMRQIAAGSQQSQVSVRQLSELADDLKQLVSKFKL